MSHPEIWGDFVLIAKAEETIDRNLSPFGWWDKLLLPRVFILLDTAEIDMPARRKI
jgi:hypothetical protein